LIEQKNYFQDLMSMVCVPQTLFHYRRYLNKINGIFHGRGYQRAGGRPWLQAPAPRYYMPGSKVV